MTRHDCGDKRDCKDQRAEIEEVIALLGLLVDSREWQKLEGILAENIELDYRSLFGGSIERLPRHEVVTRWRSLLTPLKGTQHLITNLHVAAVGSGRATCAAHVQATHVRPNETGDSHWTVAGRYDFRMNREKGGWKISAIKLTVLWTTGNPHVLTLATTAVS